MEEAGQQEEGGALIEAVALVVDQAAAAAGEGVLLEDGDFEAGFGEAGGGADAAYSGAYIENVLERLFAMVREGEVACCWVVSLPITMAVFCLGFSDIVIASYWGLVEGEACLVLVLVGWERWSTSHASLATGSRACMTPGDYYALANPIYMDAMRSWAAIGRSLAKRSMDWKKPVGSYTDLITN